tara:strand:+ start:27256 stop:27630 length:375 start_codon:yes stop_codon:yes gene_type:complete
MGLSAGDTTQSVFKWLAHDSILSLPLRSPLLLAFFIVLIFCFLFYLFYDVDDPFHSFFKLGAITTVITIVLLYAHSSYIEEGLRDVLQQEFVINDFKMADMMASEKDQLQPNVEGGKFNPFEAM